MSMHSKFLNSSGCEASWMKSRQSVLITSPETHWKKVNKQKLQKSMLVLAVRHLMSLKKAQGSVFGGKKQTHILFKTKSNGIHN